MAFTTFSYMIYTLSGDLNTGTLTELNGIESSQDITHTEVSGGTAANTFEVGEQYSSPPLAGNFTYQGYFDHSWPVERMYLFESVSSPGTFIFTSANLDVTTSETDPNPGDWPQTVSAASLVKTDVAHCFGPGTQIATPSGEVAVEQLVIGDRIFNAEGREISVKWIGRQAIDPFLFTEKLRPVRIAAGALGGGLPHSDLIVSADHGMIVDGLVINASVLVNDDTISFATVDELESDFTYYHIETEDHDVILANGAPSETFIDVVGRRAFDNHAEYLDLYGTERIIPEMDHPRISAPRLLPQSIRARLGIAEEMPDLEMRSA